MSEEVRIFQLLISELHKKLTEFNSENVKWQIQDDYFGIEVFTNLAKDSCKTCLQICLQKSANELGIEGNQLNRVRELGKQPIFVIYEFERGKDTKRSTYTDRKKLIIDVSLRIKNKLESIVV